MPLLNAPLRKLVPLVGFSLATTVVAAGSITPAIAADGENVRNGDFSTGTDQWFTTGT